MEGKKNILVTGAAGFIGYHLCETLLSQGHTVIGLDNINDYYDINLKYARLNNLGIERVESFNSTRRSNKYGSRMQFIRMNLEDREALPILFRDIQFDVVCNLAAQAGVRYSLESPEAYVDSNVSGFLNILECCRHFKVKRLVYASSSSVYGISNSVPFTETSIVDSPISLYAATKRSNELMAHTYSHLFKMETIGLRFFTVYGPWGRPDMAMFIFTDAIMNNRAIKVFNEGILTRDFTYVDDIIKGVYNTLMISPKEKELHRIYNLGSSSPIKLMDFIRTIENKTGINAKKEMMTMQPGDVYDTFADVEKFNLDYSYKPTTSIEEGVESFIKWYNIYYK